MTRGPCGRDISGLRKLWPKSMVKHSWQGPSTQRAMQQPSLAYGSAAITDLQGEAYRQP